MRTRRTLILAAQIVDAAGADHAPGAVLVEGDRIIAAGAPATVGGPDDAARLDRPDRVILPALVNAHAHLDLSPLGPQPTPARFTDWIQHVRAHRATTDDAIAEAVTQGAALARAGGTAIVGDIAGISAAAAVRALASTGLAGVSYLEVFGTGRREERAIERMEEAARILPHVSGGVRLGLQPHAPYSCGRRVYERAAALGLPLSTHLAESLEELDLLQGGTGPLREMLRSIGVWEEPFTPPGAHPIDVLAEVLARTPVVAAHLNYVEDRHVEQLARWPVTVAYCPRASAYFGHPQDGRPPHRYREMIDAGVRVALGTDSLLCLDTPERISVLDDMRFLFRRDGADPMRLLAMGTTAGAAALGFDPNLVTLAPGPTAGLISLPIDPADPTEPWRQALAGAEAPRWEVGPIPGATLIEAGTDGADAT